MLIPLKEEALERMQTEYPVEYSRYMGMIEHGANSKLATEKCDARVLFNDIRAKSSSRVPLTLNEPHTRLHRHVPMLPSSPRSSVRAHNGYKRVLNLALHSQ